MRIAVVGAGLSGAMFNQHLSNPDADVTVFESGSERGYGTLEPRHQASLGNTLAFGNGGTTNLWHNGLIRSPASNFPQALTDHVATLLGYTGDYSLSIAKSRYIKDLAKHLGDDVQLDAIYYPNVRQRLKVENSKVVYDSYVYKLDIVDNSIRGLWYKQFGKNHYFECDLVVICAGGIATKNLLETSGVGNNIKVVDHPMGFIGKVRVRREFKKLFSVMSQKSLRDGSFKTCVVMNSNGLQGAFYLRSCQTLSNSLSIHKYRSQLGTSSGLKRIKFLLNFRLFHPDILREIFNYITGREFFGRNYAVMFVGEQLGDIRSGEVIDMKLKLSSFEIDTFNNMKDSFSEFLKPYIETAKFCNRISEEWLWSAAHYSFGVSGENLNKGFEYFSSVNGLYVCGGGAINRHFYTNTGLEIATHAYELARKISK